jgi:hypothetical protein
LGNARCALIATVFALAIGAIIGVGTLVIIAYILAYLEDIDRN